jgi:hypothetical protein
VSPLAAELAPWVVDPLDQFMAWLMLEWDCTLEEAISRMVDQCADTVDLDSQLDNTTPAH